MTELTPTLKISAASRRDAPLSTASTARSRKSVEYGLGMDLAPRANQFLQTRLGESTWESPRFNPTGKCSSWIKVATCEACPVHLLFGGFLETVVRPRDKVGPPTATAMTVLIGKPALRK